MVNDLSCDEHSLLGDKKTQSSRSKAFWVLIITLITMFLEIYYGWVSGSMALLADGWHMGTHAMALGITVIAYKVATTPRLIKNFNFGGGKIIALGGFASSLFLLFVVGFIFVEAIERILLPQDILYSEALTVAVIGLIINLISAVILFDSHSHGHDHGHSHDHNLRGAFLHVVMDALTSVGAIVGLIIAKNTGWLFIDPAIAIVSSLIILKWAIGLIKDTGWELLDGHAKGIDYDRLAERVGEENVEIVDLHVWRISPRTLACELIVKGSTKGIQHYKNILKNEFYIHHTVVEEQ